MVFIATDDFESYTISSDLNGASGGTNWTRNWEGPAGTWSVETGPAGGDGKAVRNTVQSDLTDRSFTAITAGIVSWRGRLSITNPNDLIGVVLHETVTTPRMYVRFGSTGNIEIYNDGTGYQVVTAYSADTWYTIDMEFDNVAQPNQYRARVDGGSWSNWMNTLGAYTSIDTFRIGASANNPRTFWIDSIITGEPVRRWFFGA